MGSSVVFDLLVSNIEQKGGWLQSTSTNTGNIAIKDMDILVGGGLPVRLGQPANMGDLASNWLVNGLLLSYLFEQWSQLMFFWWPETTDQILNYYVVWATWSSGHQCAFGGSGVSSAARKSTKLFVSACSRAGCERMMGPWNGKVVHCFELSTDCALWVLPRWWLVTARTLATLRP